MISVGFRRTAAALLATTSLVVPVPASSVTGPTLATTTAWLQSNLPTVFADFDPLTRVQQSASYSFSGCDMTVEVITHLYPKSFDAGSGNTVYTISLAPSTGILFDIETLKDSGELGGPQLNDSRTTFSFRDIQSDVQLSKHIIGDQHDDFLTMMALNVAPKQIAFTTDDSSMATRLQKALTHLAALCGAKADPF